MRLRIDLNGISYPQPESDVLEKFQFDSKQTHKVQETGYPPHLSCKKILLKCSCFLWKLNDCDSLLQTNVLFLHGADF